MTEKINPPADRFCDLVMKGGITSGIIYPRVASKLARHYRFKNIGNCWGRSLIDSRLKIFGEMNWSPSPMGSMG